MFIGFNTGAELIYCSVRSIKRKSIFLAPKMFYRDPVDRRGWLPLAETGLGQNISYRAYLCQ